MKSQSALYDLITKKVNITHVILFFTTLIFVACGQTDPNMTNNPEVNQKPVIVSSTPVTFATGSITLNIDAQSSYDLDGDNLEYQWFLNDTIVSQSAAFNETLNEGNHTIVLVVSDGTEQTTKIFEITVDPIEILDSDQDSIADNMDACPGTQANQTVDNNGCSQTQLSQLDDDLDSVINLLDICPETPTNEMADAQGCSESQSGLLDDDNDGVINNIDQCVNTIEAVINNGCSQKQLDDIASGADDDNDGIINTSDVCPATTANQSVNLEGCSDEDLALIEGNLDNDNDGVLNKDDQCKNEFGLQNLNGCPDDDNDGVINSIDQCLYTFENQTVNTQGCSDEDLQLIDDNLDNDNDGVLNKDDQCKDEFGTVLNNGCPEVNTNTDTNTNFDVNNATGQEIYEAMCADCHGDENGDNDRLGGALTYFECTQCLDEQGLIDYTTAQMPLNSVYDCDQTCSSKVSQYILNNFAGFNQDLTGQELYEGMCESCHGDGESNIGLTASKLVPQTCEVCADEQNTIASISATMPLADPLVCDTQCATLITTYMRSTFSGYQDQGEDPHQGVTSPTQACPERVIYGPRQLRLLTANEYQNTLEDLIGLDFDVTAQLQTDDNIEDFDNNFAIIPNQSHIDSYLAISDVVSSWAKDNNFSGIASCDTTSADCFEPFVREFAPKAFRRPVTDEEVAHILGVISDDRLLDNDNQNGIKLLMMSMLTSQNFLFRSEQGVDINEQPPTYDISYEKLFATWEDTDVGLTLNSSNKEYYVRENWPEDKALIEIVATATANGDGVWPKVKIKNATVTFDTIYELSGDGEQTFQIFLAEGVTGGIRHFHIMLEDRDNGAQLAIKDVSIWSANQVVTEIPYQSEPDALFVLTPFEMATYLSYNFAGTTPDDELMLAAANNQLMTQTQIESQIDRLLATDRGAEQLALFADQWLGVNQIADGSKTSKDPNLFPEFDQDVRDALAAEVTVMFQHNVLTDAPFSEFFDSNTVFINDELAAFYGNPNPTTSEIQEVNASAERGGLLTTGAFMGTYAHPDYTAPILRAVRIREKLMCQYLPDPPNNLDLEREESEAALIEDWESGHLTSREYFGGLTETGACASCHEKWINPLGFALEDYDAIGQYQLSDKNNLTIDASGAYHGEHSLFDTDATPFNGAKGVSQFLAASERTHYCLTEKVFRFMNATGPDVITRRSDVNVGDLENAEIADYSCAMQNTASILSSTQDVKEVFKTLGVSTLVRYRKERNR